MGLTMDEMRKCYSKVLKKLFQSKDNGYELETVRQLGKISFSKDAADQESYSRNFGHICESFQMPRVEIRVKPKWWPM